MAVGQAGQTPRPNILWFVVDDMSANFSCYGEKLIQTPHVDRLAEEGVRFTRAYATSPVCSSFRSALITGMYQTTIGTQHMRCSATLPEFIKPFTIALRASGYYCTNNSKRDYQFAEPKETWETGFRKTVQGYFENDEWIDHIEQGTYQGQRLGAEA